jgi:hypothetical protein
VGIAYILKNILPVLAVIFFSVVIIILVLRIVLAILLHFNHQIYLARKEKQFQKFQKREKATKKADEARFIKKQTELQAKKQYEKITSQDQERENEELNDVKIVDIVKPVGFWTSMILGQKLTYLVSSAKLMNQNKKDGFWTSMVKANERAAGRQRGRGL